MADERVERMADKADDKSKETVTRESETVTTPATGDQTAERQSETVTRERESSESKK